MQQFAQLSDGDIRSFCKEVNKMPANAAGNRPSIPFASIKKLKAMRHWTIERTRTGLAVEHPAFTDDELTRVLERMDYESQLEVNKPEPPALPDIFVSFGTKWRSFYEGFRGHLAVARGCMNIPLLYVVREHEAVTAEIRGETYASSDERLMATTVLAGAEYNQDNHRVWDLLRPLVYGTAAWNYVKSYDNTKNGRTAFRVLERRGEGEAALDARRTKAEKIITSAVYNGKSKRFTVGSYTNLLQGAFTEMEEVGEPLSERRKVDTYVKGMQAERLKSVKTAIMQNPTYRNDFQQAYTFVEMMEQFDSTVNSDTHGFDRNISSVTNSDGTVDTSYRSPAEWAKLSKEEKAQINSARDKKGIKKRRNNSGKNNRALKKLKRQLSELASTTASQLSSMSGGSSGTTDGDSSGGDSGRSGTQSQTGTNPADQFGRQAHAVTTNLIDALQKLGAGNGQS